MAGRIEFDELGRAVLVHQTSAAAERAIVDAVKEQHNRGNFGASAFQ